MIREDTWTAPSEWCPRPDYWHAPDGDSTEKEVTELVAAFVRALQPEIVVETGTAWGQTAYAVGCALASNGHGRLYTLEMDIERVDYCQRLCHGLPVEVIEGSSLDFTPPGPVGFAWFDSLIPLRVPEFRRYREHLVDGCIVGFHDAGPQHALWPLVEALETEGLIKTIRLRTPRGVVFAQVL